MSLKKKSITIVIVIKKNSNFVVCYVSVTIKMRRTENGKKTDRYSDYYSGEWLNVNTFFVQICKNRIKALKRMTQRC